MIIAILTKLDKPSMHYDCRGLVKTTGFLKHKYLQKIFVKLTIRIIWTTEKLQRWSEHAPWRQTDSPTCFK